MKRHTEKSIKHWFSIYQLVERYLEQQRMEANTGVYTECDVWIQSNDQLMIQLYELIM